MKKLISRVCCLCCVVLVLAACLPLSAFAVDPVSAGVIANAFAQAIAAYGASNGVAMTFDVASTDGIGESVHELWKEFRAGTQDADDYATLAAALFPELYYKASSVVGGVADVYTVGYNISSTYAEEFDNFFDWLLSGPAEMVKVDNAFYQFSQSQIGSNSSPLAVYSGGDFALVNSLVSGLTDNQIYDSSSLIVQYSGGGYTTTRKFGALSFNTPVFSFAVPNGNGANYDLYVATTDRSAGSLYSSYIVTPSNGSVSVTNLSASRFYYNASYPNFYFYSYPTSGVETASLFVPVFSTWQDALSSFSSFVSSGSPINNLGVKASTNTGVAEFPDTSDPNYEAVGKQIPSTVPWDNSAYGDGTGTLTDAQSGAIAAGADTVIAQDGVLDLVESDEITDQPGTDDPPSTDPDDYAVPGLSEIFPFCIPFDIYNFLSALSAQPVAPHFTATLDFPEAVGGTQTIDIDFDSPTWNQLAQLLRLLELLAFIIGLALLTRSMFLRG